MRLGEAIRLDRADLDAAEGILTIRDSKFAKSRQIPLHPSTLGALAEYGQLRDQHWPSPKTPAMLVSTAGTRLISQGIHYVFARLVRQAGLQPRSQACRPRLHDFRHSLAVNTQMGRIASDASFRSLRERALPAAQRAALPGTERPGARDGAGDLRLHGQPGSDATMMQQVPLRCVRHRCA